MARGDTDEKNGSAGGSAKEPGRAKMPEHPGDPAGEGSAARTEELDALKAEVTRLRTENERLTEQAARAAEPPGAGKPPRARMAWAMVLVVVGSLLAAFAVPAVWLNRMVTDTDTYVATVSPLASDPTIQNFVADSAADAVFEAWDAKAFVRDVLPEKARPLATPIAGAIESLARDQAKRFTKSEAFKQIWVKINRTGHAAFVAAVTGREGVVSIERGVVSLDLGLLVEQVKQQLVDSGLDIAERIPTAAVDRQIVLLRSDALARASVMVDALVRSAIALPLLALVALGCAVALATDRRRAALWVGVGLTVAMVLPLEGVYFARSAFVDLAGATAKLPTAVAASIYRTVFRDLVSAQQGLAAVGLVIWLSAVVAGPASWAVSLRGAVRRGLAGVGAEWDFGPFGTWIAGHKGSLRGAGRFVAALVLLLTPSRGLAMIVTVVVLAILYVLALEFFGRAGPEPAPE